MSEERPALAVLLQDSQGREVGGFVLLDPASRLTCDWFGGCTHRAVIGVWPSSRGGAAQLACGTHFPNIHLAVWRTSNPPRLLVKNGATVLARNDQVK